MKIVPLWSNVLLEFRPNLNPVGTSAYIESFFNILKNNVFKNEQSRMRLDEYLLILLDHLDACCLRILGTYFVCCFKNI